MAEQASSAGSARYDVGYAPVLNLQTDRIRQAGAAKAGAYSDVGTNYRCWLWKGRFALSE